MWKNSFLYAVVISLFTVPAIANDDCKNKTSQSCTVTSNASGFWGWFSSSKGSNSSENSSKDTAKSTSETAHSSASEASRGTSAGFGESASAHGGGGE